jgi:hypothetical protein
MTSSRRFDRLLQVACLGLVGILAGAGCGGSSKSTVDARPATPPDAALTPDSPVIVTPDGPVLPANGLTVDQATLNFGQVDQGASLSKTVTVTNTGLPSMVSAQVTGAGYIIQSNLCGTAALGTGKTCTITVAFSPAAPLAGGSPGTLTIANGPSVSLSGTAMAPGTFSASLSVLPATALVNQAVPFTVTVTPVGPLPDLSCINSGPDLAPDPAPATPNCAASVAVPVVQSCTYSFIFKAAKAGVATDKVSCSSGGTVRDLQVSLNVLSPATLSISPASATFPGVVGTTSDAVTFIVRNNGTASSGAVTAALGGTGAAQFSITDNRCSGVLTGLTTCTVAVAYAPTAAGNVTATLTATDATVGSTPAVANLSGTAVTPGVLAIAGASDLGSVTVGAAPATSTFTVTNTGGSATDAVTIAASDPQFAIGNSLCGPPLAAAATCTFTVSFAPASAGLKTTVLTASSGTVVSGQKPIQGTGVAAPKGADLGINPTALNFGTIGRGTTAGPQTFTITNNGGTTTGVLAVTPSDNLASGGASQFTFTTTCGIALAPASSCFVAVTFAPTIPGSASANFTVGDGTVSAPAGTATGIALDHPTVSFTCGDSPYYVISDRTGEKETFTDTVLGKTTTLACTVTNDPNSPQDTGAITIVSTSDFAVPAATNSCTASLRPGLSCNFALTFTPTAMGSRTGTVTVTTANQGVRNQDLSGIGLGVIEVVEFANPHSPDGACAYVAPVGPLFLHTTACFPLDTTRPGSASNLVDPEPFDFGQQTQGTTSTTMLTLAVYVRAAVGNLAVTKDFGTPADSFQFASSVPVSLGAPDCSALTSVTALQASSTVPACYKIVQFVPQLRTVLNGTVTVNGAAGQTDSATVTGTGTGPLTIAPSPVTFSNVGIGTASNTIILTVKNCGATAINNLKYTLTGAQFQVVEDSLTGSNLAAATGTPVVCGTQTLGVKYIPTTAGGATGSITVTGTLANGAGNETQTVNLTGNGATGAVMTVAISNNGVFANTAAGAFSAPLTVTVNNATGSLPTGNVTFTPSGLDFTVDVTRLPAGTTQGTCQQVGNTAFGGMPVAGGGSCTYLVWFAPSKGDALVARTGTLLVTASPGGSFSLPLSGTALPQITLSPTSTVASPVDLGTAVIGVLPNPSVMFTVTNNAATDIPPNGLLIQPYLGPNIPNNQGLFQVDTTATNTCNTLGAPKNGGTCAFKLSAIALTGAPLGVNYSRVLVQVLVAGVPGPQNAQVDVKATVVTKPQLQFTPATDFFIPGPPAAPRDLGTVALGGSSAPAKFTVVNVGGTNSGPITASLSLHGQPAVVQTIARYSVDASDCTSLGEAGLAPGRTCDIFVTFTPDASDTNANLLAPVDQSVDLVVPPTNGLAAELRRWVRGEVTATQTGPYLVDSVATNGVKRAPAMMTQVGITNVYTATVEFHAGNTAVTPVAPLATVTGALGGDTVAVAAGAVSGCVAGTPVTATNMCTLTITFTAGATTGWRVFTVTTSDASATTMNVFARVAQPAVLVASRSPIDFGESMIGVQSQTQTVVITNIGEATTATNVAVTPIDVSLVNVSGCAGLPLAYMGTCTLTITVTPPAVNVANSSIGVTPTAAALNIGVSWNGVTASQLTTTSAETDFLTQAVLSTTTTAGVNPRTFTFQNGAHALMTGPLAISVLNGTAVDPDFVITGGTCVTTNAGLGLDLTQTCTVTVVFIPTALATPAKTGMLTVTATPGGTATVKLDGKAVPALSVSAPGVVTAADGSKSLNVGTTSITGSGASATVTFTNEAGAPTTGLLSVALAGADAADFRVTNDTCTGAQLPPGPDPLHLRNCTVTLTFAPTVAGAKTATIAVSGSPGDSALLTLTGTGTSP